MKILGFVYSPVKTLFILMDMKTLIKFPAITFLLKLTQQNGSFLQQMDPTIQQRSEITYEGRKNLKIYMGIVLN